MKKWKKWRNPVTILAAAVLLMGTLTGCGGNAAGGGGLPGMGTVDRDAGVGNGMKDGAGASGGTGRFMESEIALPEGTEKLLAMEKLQDGSVEILGYSENERRFFTAKTADFGADWQMQIIDWVTDHYVAGGALRSDGTAALLQLNYEGGNVSNEIAVVGADGAVEILPLTMPENFAEGSQRTGNDIKFDGGGNLLLRTARGDILKTDQTTGNCEVYCDLEGGYTRFFGVAGGQILVVTSPAGIRLFDSTDGSELPEDAFLNEMIAADESLSLRNSESGTGAAFAGGLEEDSIFYVTHDGVFHHSTGGVVSEQLINGALNFIGDTSTSFLQLVMPDEEHILLSLVDGAGAHRLLLYSYDRNAPAFPEKELKVYALLDSDYLRQVVSAYQRSHQDVYVNLTIGMSGRDAMTAEDAVRLLNTDILAGAGPDVLILDGLPMDDYVEKGILADIAPLVKEIARQDGMFENIVSASAQDGAIYGMPSRFYFHLIGGDEDALAAGAALSGLADYGEKLKADGARHIFGGGAAKRLLAELYGTGSEEFLTDDGTFDEEALKEWLTVAKRIYDVEDHREEPIKTIADNSIHSTQNMFGILLKESKATLGSLVSVREIATINAVKEQTGMDYDVLNRDAGSVFVPYQTIGIVNDTRLRAEAEEFARMMLGSVCGKVDGNGFPVNRAAYDAICEAAKNQYDAYHAGSICAYTSEGVHAEAELKNLTDADVQKLTIILESLETMAPADAVIREVVTWEAEQYLLGLRTKEDVLAMIVQRCRLYLAE